ncbi:MAG TPA: hypothetical protein VFO16_20480 [Pseudonocardiaceae bacterium]|nr:hypothetical protein [Pseudonocardiaceae bacterium]
MSQEDAGISGGAEALRHELERMRERMATIKKEVAADLDSKWGSPWKSEQMFDLKLQSRLSGNGEYTSLRGRIQEAEARLAAEAGAD